VELYDVVVQLAGEGRDVGSLKGAGGDDDLVGA
jgi:hypothetical protein